MVTNVTLIQKALWLCRGVFVCLFVFFLGGGLHPDPSRRAEGFQVFAPPDHRQKNQKSPPPILRRRLYTRAQLYCTRPGEERKMEREEEEEEEGYKDSDRGRRRGWGVHLWDVK